MTTLKQIPVSGKCKLLAFGIVTRLPNINKQLQIKTIDGLIYTIRGSVKVGGVSVNNNSNLKPSKMKTKVKTDADIINFKAEDRLKYWLILIVLAVVGLFAWLFHWLYGLIWGL